MNNLFICCTHHKTGTVLFKELLKDIALEYQLKLQICDQSKLQNDTNIWLEWHSNVDFDRITRPYRCVHIIRDPRDIVVSGYFYHLRCVENWCTEPRPDLENRSYQEILRSLSPDEGLEFEMNHIAKQTIEQMLKWDYNRNHDVLELKYESLMQNYKALFKRIFRHAGFPKLMVTRCLEISDKHNINNLSENELKRIKHVHSRELHKWKKYFTEKHKDSFKELLGDSLIKLGYEKNNNW